MWRFRHSISWKKLHAVIFYLKKEIKGINISTTAPYASGTSIASYKANVVITTYAIIVWMR